MNTQRPTRKATTDPRNVFTASRVTHAAVERGGLLAPRSTCARPVNGVVWPHAGVEVRLLQQADPPRAGQDVRSGCAVPHGLLGQEGAGPVASPSLTIREPAPP